MFNFRGRIKLTLIVGALGAGIACLLIRQRGLLEHESAKSIPYPQSSFSTALTPEKPVEEPAAFENNNPAPSTARPMVFGTQGLTLLEDVPASSLKKELTRISRDARAYALNKLGNLHVPLNDVASLHVDETGHLYYECAAAPVEKAWSERAGQAIQSPSESEVVESAASVPISTPPVRHSKPGASKVIYLDFNGHTITGTQWNKERGSPGDSDYRAAVASYVAKPFSSDADDTTFSDAEQTQIVRIWERVSEDFRPFDVDVTTEEPAAFTANTGRVLITKSVDANGVPMPGSATSAGIAYIDVFGSSTYVSTYSPALVYADKEYYYEDYISEGISHEMGHNLSLSHDGLVGTEYYGGHGSGATSWGPLMGGPYNRNITQWSKGEYYNANNPEDDLAIIAGHLGYAAAAPADNNSAAVPLTASGTNLSGQGVIGNPGEADRFSFTVAATTAVSFTVTPFRSAARTDGGNLDVQLMLYDSSNNLVASGDAANATATIGTLSTGLSAGTYYLRVAGEGAGTPLVSPPWGYTAYGSMGLYSIAGTTSSATAPGFTQQPGNWTGLAGLTASFSVLAIGNPSPTFQWQRLPSGSSTWVSLSDSSAYSGTKTVSLSVVTTTAMSGDQFRCVASNVAGSVASNGASLTVSTMAPAVSSLWPPLSQTVKVGETATFSGTVTGYPTPTCQWQKNGVDIPGATTNTLTLKNVQLADAGTYRLVATNSAGSASSPGSALIVLMAPAVTTQPLSGAVFSGGTVTFSAAVSGSPAPTYQWQKNGINVAGATNTTLTLSSIQVSDAGSYALVATNSAGSATSRFARLVVLVPQANATVYEVKAYPTGVTPGGNVNLEYVMTNIGTRNWGSNHYLSIRDSNNTFVAFTSLIGTNSGESKVVNLNFPAPMTLGTYTYTVQGLEGGVEFFTTQTTFTLNVLAQAGNSITYNATNFPITATPGSSLIFNYNVTNTGTKSWGTNHFLSLRDGASVYAQFSSLNGVAPGQSKTVNLSFTAPSTPGVYPYFVQALESGAEFFAAQANLMLTVLAPQPNAIVYTKTRSQDNVTPGATVSLRYSLNNAGTGTWGASHYASLRDNNGNFLAFVPLAGVVPGGSTTVNFSFVAPTTPGSYSYFVQALQDGVEFFDKQELVTLNVLPLPIANAATYNATTFPATTGRGITVTFTHNVTNRGTKTWGANHYLALRDADSTFLGFPSLNGIAPGQSKTVSYTFLAPNSSGVFTYHVQGLEGGVEFFNEADDLVLIVP